MRFRTLLSLVVIIPTLAAATAIITTMYIHAEHRSAEMGQRLLLSATEQAAEQVQDHSKQAADLARTMAALANRDLPLNDPDRLSDSLLAVLKPNTGVTWLSFSTPAGDFTGAFRDAQNHLHISLRHIADGKTNLREFTVADDGSRTLQRQDPDFGYDPRTRPFYVAASQSHDIAWSAPYIFYDQGVPGISCAIAVYAPTGELRGVFSVDYDLNRLSDLARQLAVSPNSHLMIFTADRILVAHSAIRVTDGSARRADGKLLTLDDTADPPTRLLAQQLKSRDLATLKPDAPESLSIPQYGDPLLACITPVQLDSGPTEYVAAVAPAKDFGPSAWQASRGAILIAIATSIAGAIAAVFLAHRISRPLLSLVAASERIGDGNFDVDVHLGPLYEFQHLATALRAMLVNLKDWARVRLSLQLATEIQRSLLPLGPPKVPGFDIAGYSNYCDETGGDYYDFIIIDRSGPERFMVALGDVMGHGLPSALLMAGARGILRSSVSSFSAPGALLTHMNRLLFHDTSGRRFMTMCLTDFDLRKSAAVWASAGHDPPIIFDTLLRAFIELEGGDIPLGVAADVEYGNYPLGRLSENLIIFIGSDGVWETFSAAGEQFGKDRVKKLLAEHADCSADELKNHLLNALTDFRGQTPIKDDVTFVLIKTIKVSSTTLP